MSLAFRPIATRLLFALSLVAAIGCNSDTSDPVEVTPVLTTVTVSLPITTLMVGQTVTPTAAGLDQNGATIALGAIAWSTSAAAVATVNATGVVTAVAPGTTEVIATTGGKSGQKLLTVVAPPAIKLNEVESNGGTPGDWAEFYNPTTSPVDLSGWVVKDNDDTHSYVLPAGSIIPAGGYFVAEEAGFGFGLGAADAVRLFNPFGVLVESYSWTAHAATSYGRCVSGTSAFVATTSSTKGVVNDCSVAVVINEIESNGGTPGDWIELYNAGASPADLSGYVLKDNDDTHSYALPAATTLAAGAYLIVEEAALGFGLGGADAVRFYTPTGGVVDSYTWAAHAAITYGRCTNGSGAFIATGSSTKGAVNGCAPVGPVAAPWPGSDDAVTVDGVGVFQTNGSGLTYEGAVGGSPAVLWAARNGPGTIFRMIWNGTTWSPDAANNWAVGKALRYPDGTGNPDTEGLTFAAGGSVGGMYVATERNNDASTISRNSVLRFDPNQAGAVLTATNDWNLTADLPAVGANLGIEAITWVPDSYLVAQGFYDEAAGHTYVPAEYANHGTGLFIVGVEGNGILYAYALNHVTNGFTRIATIGSGFTGVMGLEFDRELNYLWATCDDGCGTRSATLEIDVTAGSPTRGRFIVTHLFERPSTLVNVNNEGFAIAPQSECVAGKKSVFWADDNETGGHTIRRASLPCTRFP